MRPAGLVGYVDERSPSHLAGWVWNGADPSARIAYDVVEDTPDGGRILATGVADGLNPALVTMGFGDGRHGFLVFLMEPVADVTRLQVRVAGDVFTLPLSPHCTGRFEPLGHVAMDVVNNCNLRCPFCVYDYTGVRTTELMDDATFDSVLRLLPYVRAGNLWLSCLHEPTLHPRLMELIGRIPVPFRDRVMFTTNLAKRMPDAFFAGLAESGLHNINISVESLVPAVYERLRKGARHRIFSENWAKLLPALRAGAHPPRVRYIMMAYRSNLAELPGLVTLLLAEKSAWQVEVRYTFEEEHIAAEFRRAELLTAADWDWLAAQLAHHDPDRVLLIRPPIITPDTAPVIASDAGAAQADPVPVLDTIAAPAGPAVAAGYPLGMRIDWDGQVTVYSQVTQADGRPLHTNHLEVNINAVEQPADMIGRLLAGIKT